MYLHPKDLLISSFNYNLPETKIAQHPLPKRDDSKLLVYKTKKITEDEFFWLDEYISASSLLVFNNSKVVEARLLFKKSSGTQIEIFCLEPDESYNNINAAMQQTQSVIWKCLVGNAKKWKDEILIKDFISQQNLIQITGKKIREENDHFLIEFRWNDEVLSFADVLHAAGIIPLPPYMQRNADGDDAVRYQTIYAKYDGSVAAPTAGLHFTDNLFQKLNSKNIQQDFVTLHVGAGTFKPVKTATMHEHEMHAEYFEVKKELIENISNNINNIIAVGTTTLRTIESLYWMGVKVIEQKKKFHNLQITPEVILIKQWDAYKLPNDIPAIEALHALLLWMKENNQEELVGKTQIIIAPPYRLKIAGALITNFHQPKSTLLLLVAAIIGDDWKRIYNYALENNFRFLSYGDSCLLFAE